MQSRVLQPFGDPGFFFEGARWHDGVWWISDFHDHAIFTFTEAGERRRIVDIDDQPSGLGWMPDGSLLFVSMNKRQILRRSTKGAVSLHADLTEFCGGVDGFLNDLVVDRQGRAYVSFDPSYAEYGFDSSLGRLLSVDVDGHGRLEAENLVFPNGLVITEDGSTLIAAETFASRLTSFKIGADGVLGPGSAWADLSLNRDLRPAGSAPLSGLPSRPDGCCLDASGHVWMADVDTGCIRVAHGGAIVDAVFLPDGLFPWTCMLGGEDLKTLLICAGTKSVPDERMLREGRLFTTRVDVPHGGFP